jgi:hypothetical protein
MDVEKTFLITPQSIKKSVHKQNKKYFCLLDILTFFVHIFLSGYSNNFVYLSFINHVYIAQSLHRFPDVFL